MRHGDGVAGNHQLHCLHLAGGLHVGQDAGYVWSELLVLQQGDGLGADAFEQVDAPVDRTQVDVERPGQPFLAYAPIDGAADDVVLGDGRQPIDVMVVGKTFVVFGEQTGADAHAQLFQGQYAQMAVQHQVLGLFSVGLDDGQRLDQSHLVDAGDDLFVLACAHDAVGHLLAGQQLVQRDLVGLKLKAQQGGDALGQVLGQGVQAFGAQQVDEVLVGKELFEDLHHQEQPLVGVLGLEDHLALALHHQALLHQALLHRRPPDPTFRAMRRRFGFPMLPPWKTKTPSSGSCGKTQRTPQRKRHGQYWRESNDALASWGHISGLGCWVLPCLNCRKWRRACPMRSRWERYGISESRSEAQTDRGLLRFLAQ